MTNPFATAPAPAPVAAPTQPDAATVPAPAPTPFPTSIPAPVTIAATQNPATVDPMAAQQAAQYAAWQAQQLAAQAAAMAPAPAPTAPPVAVAPPGVDPAQWAAFQAQQSATAVPVPAPTVPQTPFLAPPVAPAVTATAPPSSGSDPFDDPAPQRPRGPRLRDMYGRLLIIIPKGIEQVDRKQSDGSTKRQDRLTADVIVLDDGRGGRAPIPFGGEPEKPGGAQHDQLGELPYRINGMYISAVGLISQTRDTLKARQAGGANMTVGRLVVGEAKAADQSPPYLLDKATDADKALARAYTATIDPFA